MSLEQLFLVFRAKPHRPRHVPRIPPSKPLRTNGSVESRIGKIERKQAFFDEQLQSLLLLRIQHPTPDIPADPKSPPVLLLEFLNYLQVSLEASYISPMPVQASHEPTWTSRLSAPPRAMSARPSAGLSAHQPPSIFPPATPNPIDSTQGSEGAFLAAIIWGAGSAEQSKEAFSLLWSEKEKVWVAVYRLALTVYCQLLQSPIMPNNRHYSFETRPIATSEKHPLAKFLSSLGVTAPDSPTEYVSKKEDDTEEVLLGWSIRLGAVSRQKLFSLPPVLADTPVQPSPSPMTAVRKAHPTLRKSYRRTLQTISTFQLRMRTVFVPYREAVSDIDEVERERERREAGSAERTVVLCIEIKNSGAQEVQSGIGFLVESVDIKIAGEGAKTTLVGWGKEGLSADAPKSTVNLLYAVTFLRSPEELDSFSFAKPDAKVKSELRRGVSITCERPTPDAITLPTRTFSSVWSTVLDLDANPAPADYPTALPEPASPFPMYALGSSKMGTPMTAMYQYSAGTTPQSSVFAGSRKFPLTPGGYFQNKVFKNTGDTQSPGVNSARSSSGYFDNRNSAIGTMQYLRSPTTYGTPSQQGPPPPPHSPSPGGTFSPMYDGDYTPVPPNNTNYDAIPPTPAYPAFPQKSTLPPSPMSQGPIASQSQNNVGPSVEVRRDRMSMPAGGLALQQAPPTPLPHVSAAFGEQRMINKLQNSAASGENVVVSVGLLPMNDGEVPMGLLGHEKIYPLDTFTLDIFVFNQSTWTRRFEVTCPEKRRRRRGGAQTGVYGGGGEVARKMGYPGVLPMTKRVRIGPLRTSACQSVRMEFLAVSPGVHSIDTLTLTDIETGFSMNLSGRRSPRS
ncbi:TRAPP trafficking subunit Trs65-domain-containing protein [Ephemerocybe angulata]|uniref:TRAPP trafficking subunit Trs65-domain-containing protein n=1 Tax=Ephemerocybe angulata TaxID=980116 RepID=A0A8H6LYR2_9AGAR|nr:TRAPP trafficking subunit Trs65-domain-containing protein [Tulosesus angulatus]